MFTGSTKALSEFSNQFGLSVQRDTDFAYVGKIPTRLAKRIVPCGKPAHIHAAAEEDGVCAIITTGEHASLVPDRLGLAIADDPVASAMQLHEFIARIPDFQWQSFESRIHSSATIYPGAYIAERDVEIGEDAVIYPNAVIMPRTIIGARSTIGPGTVVGTDAFEVNLATNPLSILVQAGGVRIGDDVDLQAKCTIIRATFGGFTEIGDESKFDCQIHLAHDCVVGRRVRIAACAEVSGRVEIEDDCFIGPNASISNGLTLGARTHITIGAVVVRDTEADSRMTGNFAVDHRKWISFMRGFK
ncbi:UDP-3-O-[3-hydroxymyristoyl] glucosamine N-acyltransferase [Sphingopyxis panaciterrae]|uniref:UDP-3-O-(3-hydroxymyristoyl)glucosamine N-acyltransferase n=1 Tax=Sphingopyxis panaciterrae TaxID=363841 RepID=UPI001422FC44|nr:UDP-3-O-(3-hydroxymyristoyl)glucosamine N-acyltransferase [Sphingopyxis panaciterrae]NIJ36406.1 UDP-3-O-[3-hydroxymyristoyl] glucosamine N-acyltransferase [Sphingopyxis panaciterrae]